MFYDQLKVKTRSEKERGWWGRENAETSKAECALYNWLKNPNEKSFGKAPDTLGSSVEALQFIGRVAFNKFIKINTIKSVRLVRHKNTILTHANTKHASYSPTNILTSPKRKVKQKASVLTELSHNWELKKGLVNITQWSTLASLYLTVCRYENIRYSKSQVLWDAVYNILHLC